MTDASAANNFRRSRALRPGSPTAEAPPKPTPTVPGGAGMTGELDTRFLETLLGYNARRAALSVIAVFLKRMEPYDLRPVDFSVLSLIAHNPGVTSRQLCAALDILPPNLVGMIKNLDQRGLIERRTHPTDRRAQGLHLSPSGVELQREAEKTASALERDVASSLTTAELQTLNQLLRKVYHR